VQARWGPVLHPLLFAVYPVLYLWGKNVHQGVSFVDALGPLVLVAGVTALGLLAAWVIMRRDLPAAAVVVSVLVLLFFSYGHVYQAVQDARIGGVRVGRHAFLLPMWAALAIAGTWLAVRARGSLHRLTGGLNIVALGLILLNVAFIVLNQLQWGAPARLDPAEATGAPGPVSIPAHPPDIYYIIIDAYAGEATLRETFGYDNSPFLKFLERKGFYVAHQSTANYPRSSISVSSSLNMTYHTPDRSGRAADATFLPLFQDHAVGKFLASIGYRYVHVGSWWKFTSTNPNADVNIRFGGLSEFSTVLLQTTAAYPVLRNIGVFADRFESRRREYNRVKFQFEQLEGTGELGGPKFVFAHILCPHHPYVFDRHGNFVTEEQEMRGEVEELYVDQLVYVNTRLMALLDKLLSGPVESHPVIVLQSDEGPYPGIPGRWTRNPRPETLKRKFRNLSAYYVPGLANSGLYQTITPVNSFRLIFNSYFNAGFPLLPDKNFGFRNLNHIRDFIDLTDQVQALVQADVPAP
jgi:hypothetical protein